MYVVHGDQPEPSRSNALPYLQYGPPNGTTPLPKHLLEQPQCLGRTIPDSPTPTPLYENSSVACHDSSPFAPANRRRFDPKLTQFLRNVGDGKVNLAEFLLFQAKREDTMRRLTRYLLAHGISDADIARQASAILHSVGMSNQKPLSQTLRPPTTDSPLIVLLLHLALDTLVKRGIMVRIADDELHTLAATDILAILGRFRTNPEAQVQQTQKTGRAALRRKTRCALRPVGNEKRRARLPHQLQTPSRPDISAVVLQFAGGTGGYYLFPKFSLLERTLQPDEGVISSFYIVWKGSSLEYPDANPALDFYEHFTVRLHAKSGFPLKHLFDVVAPKEEVHRYTDEITKKTTKGEFLLLAMDLSCRNAGSSHTQNDECGDRSFIVVSLPS